jgi:D-glycero-alpha-D-manno-heptose-7-phosphate kinase
VAVALLGALKALRGETPAPREVADAAHRLEVDVLGAESGIQDQLSAAFGGISAIEIDPYPEATVEALPPWPDLCGRLSLVFLGRPHDSSALHEQVIGHVRTQPSPAFDRLRAAASAARTAVLGRDLDGFATAMVANTDAQDALHPALVGADARHTIEVARREGALGWKVNGAGGDGGSVTFVSATPGAKQALDARITELDASYRVLPVEISQHGLVVRTRD